jgi:excisionase family DNA binding protein
MKDRAYTTIDKLARRLGLPQGWLRAEANAGRLPHLRIGTPEKLRFNVDDVQAALSERSRKEAQP